MRSFLLAAISSLAVAGVALADAALADDTLVDLAQAGDSEAALALIADGADVNAAQSNGTTALHWAAYHGDDALAAALIEHGATADVTNHYGSTPLGEAANVADVELVRMLLDAGADPESPNGDGQTALMLAVRTGVVPVAEALLAAGADVNARETWREQTALMWAAAEHKPEMVRFLIENGADVTLRAAVNDWDRQITSEPRAQYRPAGGLTTLLFATRSGCEECVAALLDAGANIDEPNPDGITPLMMAIDNRQFDTAALLLDRGANPQLMDWWGRTTLYAAVDMNSYPSGGFGVSAPAENPDATTAMDLVNRLLEAGVDPNTQLVIHRPDRPGDGRFFDDGLRTGATPLFRAAVSGDLAAMQTLLDNGAEVDLPNVMGATPFFVAAGGSVSSRDFRGQYRGDPARLQARAIASMELLYAAGADVNARITDTSSRGARIARPSTMTDRQGQTAIYAAVGWGWNDVARWLIEHGAELDIVDARGKSPLDAARGDAGGRPEGINEGTAALIERALAGEPLDDPPAEQASVAPAP